MDFTTRDNRPAVPVSPAPAPTNKKSSSDKGKWSRIGVVAALSLIVILLLALTAIAASSNDSSKNQGKYVDSSKLQAVFLNTGQVYFGNVTSVAKDSMVLTNIYYLQTANGGTASQSSTSNSNVTLVKLGCELHEPYDKMIINPAQITFWENLQDNGQVAKAVQTFEKQNPQGQKCADQSSSSSTNSSNATQNAGNSSTNNSSNSSSTTNTTTNNSSNTTR